MSTTYIYMYRGSSSSKKTPLRFGMVLRILKSILTLPNELNIAQTHDWMSRLSKTFEKLIL